MKIFAPKYYQNFKCVAGDCTHSCCIGWQIEVDRTTLEKYARLHGDYAQKIKESLTKRNPHFKLSKGKRCPHLDENGLCNIISSYGEDYLCDICREHPRFYNRTTKGLEVGLGISCPTACKIVLTSDDYRVFVEVGETDCDEDLPLFNCSKQITDILNKISNRSTPLCERITKIENLYGVSPARLSDERWKKYIGMLEILTAQHKELFFNYTNNFKIEKGVENIAERALAYFIFRHLPNANSQHEFGKTLGFCLFCTMLLLSLINSTNAKTLDEIVNLAVIVSEEIEYSLDNQDLIRSAFEILNF